MKFFKVYVKYILDCIRYYQVLGYWREIGEFVCPVGNKCRGSKCKCFFDGRCGYLLLFDELKSIGVNNINRDEKLWKH